MAEHIAERLNDAHLAIYRAHDGLRKARRTRSIVIPDLYPVIGNLVALLSAIHDCLDTLPDLTAFNPDEYYDSQGLNPRESMASAEFALCDVRDFLESINAELNDAWSHIGRLGLRSYNE